MNRYLIAIMSFAAFSCCKLHTEVTYRHEGTIVKRIDECGISTFYYGDQSSKDNKIWVKYSGINDGFSGYLKFEENGNVVLLSGDGSFQSTKTDDSKFQFKRITANERPKLGKSVYYITLSTRYEQEKNIGSNTEVLTEYKVDNNEWH